MLALGCALVAVGLGTVPAFAESPRLEVAEVPRLAVLIVRDDAGMTLASRLRGELAVWGWSVRELSDTEGAPEQALEALAHQASAVAALRLQDGGRTIEIWVSDHRTGSTAIHEALAVRDSTLPEVLAVRVVETLRARLVRLGLLQGERPTVVVREPLRSEVTRAAGSEAKPPPERYAVPRLLLGAAPNINLLARGLGPMTQALTTVRLRVLPVWSVEAFAVWPLATTSVDRTEGSADISSRAVGLDTGWSNQAGRFEWGVGAGVAVAWLAMKGRDNAAYLGEQVTLTAPAVLAHALATVQLVGALRLRFDAQLGTTLRESVVRFGDRDVASWGQPFALLALGPELGLFN
jgi:hypothetical protein